MRAVEGWIDEDELPVRPGLKVIDEMDVDWEMTQDEVADRNEFVRCYILKCMEPLSLIPKQPRESDFFFESFEEFEQSAFNTMDYHRLHPDQFSKYAYAVKKVMEKAKDLAILHSCLGDEGGRERTKRRFDSLVESEFGQRLACLTRRLSRAEPDKADEIRQKISQLKRRVIECRKIWERFAPWDT
jgi:hypothetical protein